MAVKSLKFGVKNIFTTNYVLNNDRYKFSACVTGYGALSA